MSDMIHYTSNTYNHQGYAKGVEFYHNGVRITVDSMGVVIGEFLTSFLSSKGLMFVIFSLYVKEQLRPVEVVDEYPDDPRETGIASVSWHLSLGELDRT